MPHRVARKDAEQPEEQQTLDTSGDLPLYAADDVGIGRFRTMVLEHYRNHGRPMPWRETSDPYAILVSEIMLQQTRVDRVMTKYGEFLSAFPDFSVLAKAPLPEVLAAWQGMGYNRRAIALRDCAVRVMDEFGGVLPADPAILATFSGIGKATAASICAFAFNLPVVFIETNVRRVFIHYFFADSATVSDNEILPLAARALPRDNSRVWYWALMDLGTALAKTVPNPNRRSSHYAKQSAFEGSDRKIRGEILRLLLGTGPTPAGRLLSSFEEDPDRIRKILVSLEKDGFIARDGDELRLVS